VSEMNENSPMGLVVVAANGCWVSFQLCERTVKVE